MDRNIRREISLIRPYVALRKESVDRNLIAVIYGLPVPGSLSARRAWIEIQAILVSVVLLPESLSARRAWIEIVDSPLEYICYYRRSPQGERG